MIKVKLSGGGQPVVLLGLEAENVKRLKEGKPILIKGAEIQIPFDILIVYGSTVEVITKELGLPRIN
jgi:hypothetical protein